MFFFERLQKPGLKTPQPRTWLLRRPEAGGPRPDGDPLDGGPLRGGAPADPGGGPGAPGGADAAAVLESAVVALPKNYAQIRIYFSKKESSKAWHDAVSRLLMRLGKIKGNFF